MTLGQKLRAFADQADAENLYGIGIVIAGERQCVVGVKMNNASTEEEDLKTMTYLLFQGICPTNSLPVPNFRRRKYEKRAP